MRHRTALIALMALLAPTSQAQPIDPALHHLRHGDQREWDDFPEKAESDQLRLVFNAKPNAAEKTLSLRHRDLRHVWKIALNGNDLARLPQDDNAMVSLIAAPPGGLRDGANELRIVCTEKGTEADDVEVGDVALLDQARKDLLSQASVDVSVVDADSSKAIPCRLTIVDARGAMMPLGNESENGVAVRPGVVYTATGRASLRLPAGKYTLYAGRGFEWGIDSVQLDLKAG